MSRLHLDDLPDPSGPERPGTGPLGLRAAAWAGLGATVQARLEVLAATDLRGAAEAAALGGHLDGADPAVVARELGRFLALHVVADDPDRGFVPVPAVDAAWHELILDTRTYRRFCDEVFGAYLDHVPERAYPTDGRFDDAEAARDTVELLTWCFGPPDPLWAPLLAA